MTSTVKATPKREGRGKNRGRKGERRGEGRRGEGRGRGRKGKRRGGGGRGIREGGRRGKRGQEGKTTNSLLHPFPSTPVLHPSVGSLCFPEPGKSLWVLSVHTGEMSCSIS